MKLTVPDQVKTITLSDVRVGVDDSLFVEPAFQPVVRQKR